MSDLPSTTGMEGSPSLESSRSALAQLEHRLDVFLDTAEIIKEKISEIRANCASESSLAKCSSASKELQSFLRDIQTDRDQLEGRFRNFQKSLDEDVSKAPLVTEPPQVPSPSTTSSPSKRILSVEAPALDREAKRQRQEEKEDVKVPVQMKKEEPSTVVKEEQAIILSPVKQEYVELLSEDEDPGLPSPLPLSALRPILQEEESPSPTFNSPPSSDKACTHSVQPMEASLPSQLYDRWEAPPADAITQTNIEETRAPSRCELHDTRAYLHSSRSGPVAHDEAEYDKYLSLADREKKFLEERRKKNRKEDVRDYEGSACFGCHSRDIAVPHSLGRTRKQLSVRITRAKYALANFGSRGDFRCTGGTTVLRQLIVDYDFVRSRHEEQTIYVFEIQQSPRAVEVRREILTQLAGASQAIAMFYNSNHVSRRSRRDSKCKDECLHYVGHFKIKQDTLEAVETDYKAPDSRIHPQTGRKIYACVRAEFAYYHEALANAIDDIRE